MKYIIFLLSLFFLVYSGTSWSYSQCYDYLDNLDIICHTFYKNNSGIEICQEWEVKSKTYINILPNNCFNKEYNLELYINKPYRPLKTKLILFLDFLENINFKQEENKLTDSNTTNVINNIKQCLLGYIKYEKICTDIDDIFYEKDEELCNELKITKSDKHCMNLINRFAKNINSKIKKNRDFYNNDNNINIDLGDDDTIELIKNIYEGKNKNTNFYINYEVKNNNDDDNKKNDYDNELEMYYNRPRKDCVEYGLKQNYIFCAKYE